MRASCGCRPRSPLKYGVYYNLSKMASAFLMVERDGELQACADPDTSGQHMGSVEGEESTVRVRVCCLLWCSAAQGGGRTCEQTQ